MVVVEGFSEAAFVRTFHPQITSPVGFRGLDTLVPSGIAMFRSFLF